MATTADSIERHRKALERLLPVGIVWRRRPEGIRFQVEKGVAHEAANVTDRAVDLLRESDASTTVEMLTDWEAYTGMPVAGLDPDTMSLTERRDLVVQWLTTLRGSSVQFFIDLAAAFGYTITITEFRPAHCGPNAGDADIWGDGFATKCGTPIYPPDVWMTWQVNAPGVTVRYAQVGDKCGDRLATWGNALLEALFNAAKPVHTAVLFSYAV